MTFFDALSEIGDETAGGPLNIGRNMMAPLVQQGLDEGLSANRMLLAFREVGLGMRRSSFLDLVGNVSDAMEASGAVGALGLDQLPDASTIVDWRGGKANTYLHRLNVFTRETGADGAYTVTNVAWDIQSDSLLTPAEAAARVQDQWEGSDSGPNTQLLGVSLRGVYHQLGRAVA